MKNGKFYNPGLGKVTPIRMIKEISNFIKDEPQEYYSLVIGTDSQAKKLNGHSEYDFVTAVVIHRKGRGARFFWQKERVVQNMVLRDRIYAETTRSLLTAHNLVPLVRKSISNSKYELEIHIDVGPNGKTREMIKEVTGMVAGNGYIVKTKPDSWAASSVADKYA
jgi:predicted RNase H-related nuclease YkuK (DUF458 family)